MNREASSLTPIVNKISKIACVIVTYNNGARIEKLLEALYNQSKPIDEIIVVDNASSDCTCQILRGKFPQVTLLSNASNTGVGGGYARGIQYAYNKGYDWIWLLDGDSLPQVPTLEELIKAFAILVNTHHKIGILASSPTNPETNERYNSSLRRGRYARLSKKIMLSQKPFPVNSVISSGCLINHEVIKDVGLPRADFFMDFVDHEYNLRVRASGYEIIYVPSSIIYHEIGKTPTVRWINRFIKRDGYGTHPPWRHYYIVRNKLYTFWHEFRSYNQLFCLMLSIFKTILRIFVYMETDKLQKIKYIIWGVKDGFKGRLGIIVAPD